MRQQHDVRNGRWLIELAAGVGQSLVSFFSKRVGRVGMARGWLVGLVLGALGLGVLAGCTGFFQNLVGTDNKANSRTTQLVTWHGQNGAQQACLEKLNDKELAKKLKKVLGKSEAKKLKKKLEQKGHKMRKDKAQACRTRMQNATTAASSGQLVPLQEAGPDMTLVTIPFENTDGTGGALYDLQNEVDQSQQATWAGIEQGERYEHLQGDAEKSYLFPGATPTQQAITDAQQSEGFQELQADMQAQGLNLLSDGIQAVVDETEQAVLLTIPVTSTTTAPAATVGKAVPAATTPSTYYYAWVYTDELIVSGTSQVQVGSLRLDPESLNWWGAQDLADPAQLMSPYNWTPKFGATGTAVTTGATTCKQAKGRFKVGNVKIVGKDSSNTAVKGIKLRISVTGAGLRPYKYQWDFGDGSVYPDPSKPQPTCGSTETRIHEYFNIGGPNFGPPYAAYIPQVTVTDAGGATDTKTTQVTIKGGPLPPPLPNSLRNLPIVIIGGIGTTADNPDYQELVRQINRLRPGNPNVYVVDWAPLEPLNRPKLVRHIPALAAIRTQRLIHETLDKDFGPYSKFVAIGLSGGGLAMRFLIEHPQADVYDGSLLREGWDDSLAASKPWYGDDEPDVAPCWNGCGGLGFDLPYAWKDRVVRLYMMATPNQGTPIAKYSRCDEMTRQLVALGVLEWYESCTDMERNSPFQRAMGHVKPSVVQFKDGHTDPLEVDYVAAGSDATDGLSLTRFGGIYLPPPPFNPIVEIPEITISPTVPEDAPWSYYSSAHAGAASETDFGFDGIVPAQSPWMRGASRFILWDGDNPLINPNTLGAIPKGTSVHDKCLVANLWMWNRLIEHIEGRFESRSDGAYFGTLVYSREDAISGGTNAENPEPMFPKDCQW